METASLNHGTSSRMRAALCVFNADKEAVEAIEIDAMRAHFGAAHRAFMVKSGFVADSLNIGRVVICESSKTGSTGGQSLDITEKVVHVGSGSCCSRLQPIVADRSNRVNW